MDLIPVSEAGDEASGSGKIVLSERAKTLAKLRTTRVTRQADSSAEIRLLGLLEPNETTLKTVTAWTGGRIDKLKVNTTGQSVSAGQTIATLYSPEILAAHQDLIVAKRQVGQMNNAVESAQLAARQALEAARSRLRLLGVPDDELARLEGAERPVTQIEIRSPFSGTVMERIATEGSYVATGAPLFRIADLGSLWLQLDAYESDLPRLAVGQKVRVSVEALPNQLFEGKITFIDPTLDPRKRTAKLRVQIQSKQNDQGGRLLPGMFAEAVVEAPAPEGKPAQLVIPATAPLFTGRRALVYVEVQHEGKTAYEPRTVRLGPRMAGVYPVVAGLEEGERIVSRGAFALDADLQIKGGASMMTQPDDSEPGQFDEVVELSVGERKKLAPVMNGYLDVQRALAEDDLLTAQSAATKLQRTLEKTEISQPAQAVGKWRELSKSLRNHAKHVAQASSIEAARQGFEFLSGAAVLLVRQLGNPLDEPLALAHCPMAMGSRGAAWLQQGQAIDNSYFGASMRTCGEVQASVSPGAFLAEAKDAKKAASTAPKQAVPARGGHEH
jgi:Cu(I)/Ag(I) efflux system membrane fusion protein